MLVTNDSIFYDDNIWNNIFMVTGIFVFDFRIVYVYYKYRKFKKRENGNE